MLLAIGVSLVAAGLVMGLGGLGVLRDRPGMPRIVAAATFLTLVRLAVIPSVGWPGAIPPAAVAVAAALVLRTTRAAARVSGPPRAV